MHGTQLIQFPQQASDWITIWQQSLTMTLPTRLGDIVSIPITGVDPIEWHGAIPIAARVTVTDGEFFISFVDQLPECLVDKLTITITGHNPKKGQWYFPKGFLENYPQSAHDDL